MAFTVIIVTAPMFLFAGSASTNVYRLALA